MMDLQDLEIDKIFLLLLILGLSVIYLWKNRRKDFPPGPISYPLIGNRKLLHTIPHIRLTRLREKYGDIYSVDLGKQKAVIVCSFDGIMEGLVNSALNFGGRPAGILPQAFFNGYSDGGICFSELSMKYKIKKDFVLHSLDKLSCLDSLEAALSREAENFVLHLLSQKQSYNPAVALESTMLRIMLFIVNGKMYSASNENFLEIWRTFTMRSEEVFKNWPGSSMPGIHSLRPQNHLEFLERTSLQFDYQRDIVNRHKDCFNPEIVSDLVDHGLVMLERYEDQGQLDQDELDAVFVELCGSGYRQLSAVLLWLMLYVSEFPDVQNKVFEELISVVGRDRLPELSDQPYLPYTCAVILETQRLATVMPFLYPHSTTDKIAFKGYQLPKDTVMLFNIWSLHHDAKLWKHPMKFDPDRFLSNGSLQIPDYYMPFGDGLRACPGESLADIVLFTFATHLLYQVEVQQSSRPGLEGEFLAFLLNPKPYKIVSVPRETFNIEDSDKE